MGRRGPLPTPTATLLRRGSWRGKERVKTEPAPPPGRPRCPGWLSKDARTVWRRLVSLLKALGLLARCDEAALARYAVLYEKWRKAEVFLQEHGDVRTVRKQTGVDDKGKPIYTVTGVVEWPQAALALEYGTALLNLERHFGLTPSARAALGIKTEKPLVQKDGRPQIKVV